MTLLQTAERNATAAEVAERLGQVEADVILCGHTHVPRSVRTAQGQLIVNPGSVGQPAFDDDYPYPHIIESGSPDARYAIVEQTAQGWSAQLISVAYAHQDMVRLAKLRGRHDWAQALETGYLSG